MGTLPAHVQLGVPGPALQFLSSQSAPNIYQCMVQEQVFALPFDELLETPFSPFLQPVHVPPNSSTPIWYISHSSQFRIISKLAEGALCPIIRIINEGVEENWTHC